MNVTGTTTIYRKDFDGRPAYSRSIASKEFKDGQQTDNWIREYESVQLPKGTELNDKTKIEVIKGFESVYNTSKGVKRKLVVTEFNILDGGDDVPSGFQRVDDDCPF